MKLKAIQERKSIVLQRSNPIAVAFKYRVFWLSTQIVRKSSNVIVTVYITYEICICYWQE